MNSFKDKLIDLTDKLHLKLFGRRMTPKMRQFMINLSWSFYSGMIAMPVTMLIATIAGRLMGPEEFGKYNLAVLISSYLVSFVFFGLDISTVKNVVKAKTKKEKSKSFFSSFVFVVFALAVLSIITFVFGKDIESISGVSYPVVLFALFYTYAASGKAVLGSLVRGLEKFRTQALGATLEAGVLVVSFFGIVYMYKSIDFQHYMVAVFIGALAIIIYYFSKIKDYFKGFSLNKLKIQLSEGKFFMLSGLFATIFRSSDRLLITKYIDLRTLGVYSAYYLASIGIVLALSKLFTNVLLPTAAREKDKGFIKNLNKLTLKSSPITFTAIVLFLLIFLKIFGKEYPLDVGYLLMFALVSTLFFYQKLYSAIIVDAGKSLYSRYFYISSTVNFATIVAFVIVLNQFPKQAILLILVAYSINQMAILLVQQLIFTKLPGAKK